MTADRLFRGLVFRAALTVALFSLPLAITLFPGVLEKLMHGTTDLGLACASILYALGARLPPLGLVVVALAFISAGGGTLKAIRVLRHTGSVLERAPLVSTAPTRLVRGAAVAGVGHALVYVEDARPYAFTAGLLRPRIWVSSALVRHLRARELAAVLAHEARHRERRDPLRLLAARVLRATLFAAPWMRVIVERFEVAIELDADQAAMRICGRSALASALLRLSPSSVPFTPRNAAIGAWTASQARIQQLDGAPPEAILRTNSPRAHGLSAASLALTLMLMFGQAARANLFPASVVDRVLPGAEGQIHLCPMPVEGVLL